MRLRAPARDLEAVGDAVAVVVARLELPEPAVDPVAGAQHDGGEDRADQRADQDGQLDVLVARAAGAEGQLPDEQRDGEPDAGQQRQPDDVPPGEVVVELGPGEPREDPGAAEHPDQLAEHQGEHHREGGLVGQAVAEAAAHHPHPRGEEREDRHRDPGGQRPEPVLEPVRHVDVGLQGGDPRHPGQSRRPLAGLDRHDEPEQDPRDGGVDTGGVHQPPGEGGQREQQPPVRDPALHQRREARRAGPAPARAAAGRGSACRRSR